MGRRRRASGPDKTDMIRAILALGCLGLVLSAFHPRLVQALTGLLFLILILVAGVGGIALIIFLSVKRFRSRRQDGIDSGYTGTVVDLESLKVSVPERPLLAQPFDPIATRITQDDLRDTDWFQFEKIMAAVYEGRDGCRVELRGGANPDGGIDLVVYRNDKGTAVQCKHWKAWKVGVRHFREFFGGMKAEGFDRGIFVALSG